MSTRVRRLAVLALVAGGLVALGSEPPGGKPAPGADKPGPAFRFSGPYTHDNLTIFLIHGPDQIKGKKFLTLDETLGQKKVVVHETKDVNRLAVENVSAGEEVFIQAGDIVKGGQQDRLIAFDLVVPPRSGKVPLDAFCVEAGRWNMRPGEAVNYFGSAKGKGASRELKLAARGEASQRRVWDRVARLQARLAPNVGGSVKAASSGTSLQLTLEHKKVLQAIDAYAKKLTPAIDKKDDVIGYACAINGQVNSADVYATHDLFTKLWPDLLKASAVEAVAELKKDKKFGPVSEQAIKAFLADAEKGKKTEKDVNKRIREVRLEADKNVLFESRDREHKGAFLRRSYIAR